MFRELHALALSLNLSALVEVHDEAELQRAAEAGASLIGVNNRDLDTLTTDIATAERLAPLVPANATFVAESGVSQRVAAGADAPCWCSRHPGRRSTHAGRKSCCAHG